MTLPCHVKSQPNVLRHRFAGVGHPSPNSINRPAPAFLLAMTVMFKLVFEHPHWEHQIHVGSYPDRESCVNAGNEYLEALAATGEADHPIHFGCWPYVDLMRE